MVGQICEFKASLDFRVSFRALKAPKVQIRSRRIENMNKEVRIRGKLHPMMDGD